jgi:serine/threonine protein kinase
VAPLFAVRDFPSVTPMPGETFTNTKKELDALFKVIGTPSWRDIERVGMVEWRTYLAMLPARAPTVMRRFKNAGEVAIHLLTRLLEFDPERRLTCDEAMQHEYFAELCAEAAECDRVDVDVADEMNVEGLSPAVERQLSVQENTRETTGSSVLSVLSARTASISTDEDGLTIGEALAKLERELEEILHEEGTEEKGSTAAANRQDFFSVQTQRLLAMLTKECEAVTSLRHRPLDAEDESDVRNGQDAFHFLRRNKDRANDMTGSRTSLVEDMVMDDSEYARGRMSNVRDTWAGSELDASKFLKANRHGEWSEWSSERAGDGRRAAPAQGWGVSVEAPYDKGAQYAAAIRQQQMK